MAKKDQQGLQKAMGKSIMPTSPPLLARDSYLLRTFFESNEICCCEQHCECRKCNKKSPPKISILSQKKTLEENAPVVPPPQQQGSRKRSHSSNWERPTTTSQMVFRLLPNYEWKYFLVSVLSLKACLLHVFFCFKLNDSRHIVKIRPTDSFKRRGLT